ncbi:uncharacterized protein HMPREF1120_04030 [Exophiala dermatitidis NIH/UT8656]|uniref:Uncharacterized protein n=1 Tax=Exophiala dermatitidis (strain ATCC 34100 / CBS 525.76 / NIH/UT8656) TaxID=858893 RepID=H6BVP5_EXODN|nr:uncharacterized protein HMPREF1120_04030 [Exophiala dermatitidis NIH/UT8656]EHY55921.1 hypothetical protein HMPREF1120_04030 [Exophiala dermatitidis NIH/UT8656]
MCAYVTKWESSSIIQCMADKWNETLSMDIPSRVFNGGQGDRSMSFSPPRPTLGSRNVANPISSTDRLISLWRTKKARLPFVDTPTPRQKTSEPGRLMFWRVPLGIRRP